MEARVHCGSLPTERRGQLLEILSNIPGLLRNVVDYHDVDNYVTPPGPYILGRGIWSSGEGGKNPPHCHI